jgi:multicomponent K+:H+ antiporter subunit D
VNHWIIVPIVLPAITASLLALLQPSLAWQRLIGIGASAALVAVAAALAGIAAEGTYLTYALGDWVAPFGIILVLDRLSALLLLVTSVIALCSVLYAARGKDAAGRYFHALFQFQLMGLNGAFLTGDLFNLFVFFEVLLIASYCLLMHGGNKRLLGPGLHYVIINFAGSFLFLIAVSLLYATTGTLNMADMAVKVAQASPDDAALIRSGALLMLVVFSVKAALLPLYFWLPGAYSNAEAPVAALFAIMTKVGLYAILRVFTLVFGPEAGVGAEVAAPWLLPAGLLTLLAASLGALACRSLRTLIAYMTIASVGTICIGIGLATENAIGAGLYYLVHSTLAIALLFLLADLILRGRGAMADRLARGRPVPQRELLGSLFFFGAIALVGVPPLSGFFGKILLLHGAQDHSAAVWVWAVVLSTALMALIALSRAGSTLFWHNDEGAGLRPQHVSARAGSLELLPPFALVACIAALTVWAQPVASYTTASARQLLQPAQYIQAVLGAPAPVSLQEGTQ